MPERRPADAEGIRLHLVVLRCQAGDEAAFAELYEAFGPRTGRYLDGLLGDDAEDMQQEVWLAVYRSIARLSNPRAFRTWLYQTTRHRAIDFLRRRRRERVLMEDAAPELEVPSEPEDGATLDELEATRVSQALAELAPVQREVLLLRYLDQLSYAEIALVVGCSIGTVRSRLHHARRRLQAMPRTD